MKINKIIKKNIPLIIIIILVIIIIILIPFKINFSYSMEKFENTDPVQIVNELAPENQNQKQELKGNYLYPIRGLTPICAKDNLKPSFMPKACFVNGVLNSYANCKCEDQNGNCKLCYDTIIKDTKNSNVVYDAKNF